MRQSSTANFPAHHHSLNDSVTFKNTTKPADDSDESETTDVDKIFNEFYDHSHTGYKKAKSIGRISSNSSLNRNKNSGLTGNKNNKSILSKSYRSILSGILGKHK